MSNPKQVTQFFTPDDFMGLAPLSLDDMQLIADIANAKLEAALGPVVYGYQDSKPQSWTFHGFNEEGDTHQAQLFNVQPIQQPNVSSFASVVKAIEKEINKPLTIEQASAINDILAESVEQSKPDTAEDLLHEFVRTDFSVSPASTGYVLLDLQNRARALLDDVPTPFAVNALLIQGLHLKDNPKLRAIACSYAAGRTLQEIADAHNVTRERIRQMLAKFVRDNAGGSDE